MSDIRKTPPRYIAHVFMGVVEHYDYVTREMALDAENPELEGMKMPNGQEEVWENHEVVLEEDFNRLLDYVEELEAR